MKPSTREWIAKAEEDFGAAETLRRRRKPLWSVAAFHAQQCVEKYLKARLEEGGVTIPKTHDLLHLLNLAGALQPLWAAYYTSFSHLASYAVQARYPGSSVSKPDALAALKICRRFRTEARQAFGLR